ncbi:MAG: hypothetical protein VB959_20325 [Rhodospirillales bacterium]
MNKILMPVGLLMVLSGCGFVDSYEEAVYDLDPVYCYQSLAGVQCHAKPNHADKRRLVNYYGPHPSRYEAPAPVPVPELQAPPPVPFWVRDPEPVPKPFLKMSGRTVAPVTPKSVLQSPGLPSPVSEADKDAINKSRITEPLPPEGAEAKRPGVKADPVGNE